jgi:mRNA-degrading endonuclease RelE of RelBE toxin-antitoxin system
MTKRSAPNLAPSPIGVSRGKRNTYESRLTSECDDAICRLDSQTRALISSDLLEFTQRFKTAASLDDLSKGRFNYKPLKGKDCKAVNLHQIYVANGSYRVTVTVMVHDETVWFVNCFKKRGSDQKQGIDRAVRIAREIRKDTQ